MIEIAPATSDLVRAYLGKDSPRTFQGYAALKDGKPVGLSGIYREGPHLFAFLNLDPEARAERRDLVKGRRLLSDLLDQAGRPVFARMNADEPTAPKLLERMGFIPLHDDILVRMPA